MLGERDEAAETVSDFRALIDHIVLLLLQTPCTEARYKACGGVWNLTTDLWIVSAISTGYMSEKRHEWR